MAQSVLGRRADGKFHWMKVDDTGRVVTTQDSGETTTVEGDVSIDNFPTSIEVENPAGESLDVQVTGSNVVNAAVQNVTTAGTRVQLPSIACREITLIGKRANTGYIYVGGSDVSDTVYGAELAALDSITIAVENANMLYVDASVSGEGISYVAV